MKIKTHEAARSLKLHPFELMLYLAEMEVGIEDVWPEIDQDIIDTIRAQDWTKFCKIDGGRSDRIQQIVPESKFKVSPSASQVILKLWRKGHWGVNAISIETLRAHHCQHVPNLDEALDELSRKGYLHSPQGNNGRHSLNPSRKAEIDRIANSMLSG
jgi:hypothetical protein